jgi:predicted acyltransferase
MLKYILITFIFCFSTPSFCASKSFANSSLSMSYVKNEFKGKSVFSINKNALFAIKLIKKKRFPIFGVGSIISFVLAVLIAVLLVTTFDIPESSLLVALPFVFLLVSLIAGIIGLVIGEFWLWSILGILLNVLLLLFMIIVSKTKWSC